MAFFIVAKIQLVNDIDDLAKQNAVFHVLIGVGKSGLHNGFFDRGGSVYRQLFQSGKQRIVDKIQQVVTR